MEMLAPLGPVYQAGTLAGNPLATAAGLAALELLTPAAYDALSERVARFAAGLARALAEAGVAAQVPVVGPLMGLFFGAEPVTRLRGCTGVSGQWAVRPLLPRHAGAGGDPGAWALRGDLPQPGPHRGGPRPYGGGRRRGRGRAGRRSSSVGSPFHPLVESCRLRPGRRARFRREAEQRELGNRRSGHRAPRYARRASAATAR